MIQMTICAVGIGAGAWSVALVLAIVSSVNEGVAHVVTPWLLVALAVGVTAVLCVVIERSRERALRYIHAEFEGEVTDRHLSAV